MYKKYKIPQNLICFTLKFNISKRVYNTNNKTEILLYNFKYKIFMIHCLILYLNKLYIIFLKLKY